MTVEVATLFVNEDAEAEFTAAFTEGVEILKRQPGCQGLRWGKRVEPELAFILVVDWDRIEDHFAFRETEDYKGFGALFGEMLSKKPEVVHFEPNS